MNELFAIQPPPAPRWNLITMTALTVFYLVLGTFSIYFGLIGFMCFDAGVTPQAIIMFTLGWTLPLGFFCGLGLLWIGYGRHSKRLSIIGLSLPFLSLAMIFLYVAVSLLIS